MGGIIVGVDNSVTATAAARRAAVVAAAMGEPLHMVTAVKAGSSTSIRRGADEFHHDPIDHATAQLHEMRAAIGAADATTSIAGTNPAAAMCDEARRLDASMIVVGNRRVQGASRVLGSIASDVLRRAPCDVLVINTSSAGASSGPGVSTASIFRGCSADELARIDSLTTIIEVPAGRTLAEQGRTGREFGVLIDGTATVSVDGETVTTLAPGDHFGEAALLSTSGAPGRRNATVIADGAQTVAVMSIQEFSSLLHEFPQIARRIDEAMAERSA